MTRRAVALVALAVAVVLGVAAPASAGSDLSGYEIDGGVATTLPEAEAADEAGDVTVTPSAAPSSLPRTGRDIAATLGVAAGLIVLGGGAVYGARRLRTDPGT